MTAALLQLAYETTTGERCIDLLTIDEVMPRVRRLRAEGAAIALITDRDFDAEPVIKRCSCGRQYTATTWAALPPGGEQGNYELRHCPCRSTLAVEKGVLGCAA